MEQELCVACKALGLVTIAHHPSIPAGKSTTGKAVPAQCWYHKNKKPLPRHMLEKIMVPEKEQTPMDVTPAQVFTTEKEKERMPEKVCACGCGAILDPDSPWNYKRGHKPKKGNGKTAKPKAPRPKPDAQESATVFVPESFIDSWFKGLSLPEKAALFQRQFEA